MLIVLYLVSMAFVYLAGFASGRWTRPKPLTPGLCECGHAHCQHTEKGAGYCILPCPCMVYIPTRVIDSKAIAKELGVKL